MKVGISKNVPDLGYLGEIDGDRLKCAYTSIPLDIFSTVVDAVHVPDSPVGTKGIGFAMSGTSLEVIGSVGEVISFEEMAEKYQFHPDSWDFHRGLLQPNKVIFKSRGGNVYMVDLFVPIQNQ